MYLYFFNELQGIRYLNKQFKIFENKKYKKN